MGCGFSSSILTLPPEGTYYNTDDIREFGMIGLDSEDLKLFSALFHSFDHLSDCNISLHEFLPSLMLETNFLTSAIFDTMDSARDKRLSFGEFVLFSWNFLTMSGTDIEEYSFRIYDLDKTEQLRPAELEHLLGILHGKADIKGKIRALLEVMDASRSGTISKREYLAAVKKFPILVFPIFAIQDKMREGILGKKFWVAREKNAVKLKQNPRVVALFADAHRGKVPGRHHHSSNNDNKKVSRSSNKADSRVLPAVQNTSTGIAINSISSGAVPGGSQTKGRRNSETPGLSPRRSDRDEAVVEQGKGRRPSVGNSNQQSPAITPRRESQAKGRRNSETPGLSPRRSDRDAVPGARVVKYS